MTLFTHSFLTYLADFPTLGAILVLYFALSIGHVLADYPLQGRYLALTKDPKTRCKDSETHPFEWILSLYAHSLIHAGLVWIITGIVWFALAELILHAIIDILKIKGISNIIVDQLLHYLCKAVYAVIIVLYCMTT